MSIVTKSKQIFIHFPKTAGTYIEETFDKDGISYEKLLSSSKHRPLYRDQHGSKHCGVCYEEYPADVYKRFLFIREPISWYQSYISFKINTKKYNKRHWFDRLIRNEVNANPSDHSACFLKICECLLKKGISPYSEFLDPVVDSHTSVYKYENLHKSLKKIYQTEGVVYKKYPIVNATGKKVTANNVVKNIIRKLDYKIYQDYYPELI